MFASLEDVLFFKPRIMEGLVAKDVLYCLDVRFGVILYLLHGRITVIILACLFNGQLDILL
jgi:hypothetical protein